MHAANAETTRRRRQLDPESAAWVDALEDGRGPRYEQACTRLHELLVRIAKDQVLRRGSRYLIAGPELDDLAHQAAADALMRITRKVREFRGDARFTTWAYRFVVLEVSSKLSRHFWRVAHARFDLEEWAQVPDHAGVDPVSQSQARELADAVRDAVRTALSLFHPQSELARWRVRTAWTRLVIRVVEQRSLRRSRQDLRVAMACSTSARTFAWDRLTAC